MADLAGLKVSVADLTARVKASTSVEAGVATLIGAVVQQNKELAAKIASMDVNDVEQADLDALGKEVSDAAVALDQASQNLARAAAYDPTANLTQGAGAGKFPGNVSGAGNQGGIDGRPGVGSATDPDPALGGPTGGPGQFAGNPPGPAGSDNPDQPRRDQVGDGNTIPGNPQPNPQNPVPLPARPDPMPGTSAEERAAMASGQPAADGPAVENDPKLMGARRSR